MRGSVKKDTTRGTWYFVIDVIPDAASGKRRRLRRRGFPTRKSAEDALKFVLAEARDGDYVEPSSQPVRVYLENWLSGVAVGHKPSTAAMYAHKMRRYVIPRIGALRLRQLDSAALDALYAELRTSGGRPDKNGVPTPLSEQTVAVVHRILHRALRDAVRRRIIRSNPASDAVVPRSAASREMKVWATTDIRRFLEFVEDDRLQALWVVAATTGMRRGELCGLMWHDVNLEGASLAVRRARVPVAGKVSEGTPKSDRARVLACAPATMSALKAHRKRQLEERLAWGAAWQDSGYVFTQPSGAPMRPDAVTRQFEALIHAAGLPRIRLHDLRHTHATLGLAAGIPAKVMSERLGHAKVGITLDLYSHVVPGMQEEAAAKLEALIFG
jgi:integrase